MVMTNEQIILKKLFVALDDRSLNLKRIGQHLERLPRSYALESLEEAMEYRALWAEQQRERQEEMEQRERKAKMEAEAPMTMRDFFSYLFDFLSYGVPILLVLSLLLWLAGAFLVAAVEVYSGV